MTTFYSVLIYPLRQLDVDSLQSKPWAGGPLYSGVTRGGRKIDLSSRMNFYANSLPVEALLSGDVRRHAFVDLKFGHLKVLAIETISREVEWTDIRGYLIVHVEQAPGAPEIASIALLSQVARPLKVKSRAMLEAIVEMVTPTTPTPWMLYDVPRALSLSLSEEPSPDEVGLVRWEGSLPWEQRLADLVTLPKDGRLVSQPFALTTTRPTPSYLVGASGAAVGVIRLRALRRDHVAEMRTLWLDAFMVEIVQHDSLVGLVGLLPNVVQGASDRRWSALNREFRAWRTVWAWQASTDHPMESGLAARTRNSLGTDVLVGRVEAELFDHAQAELTAANERIGAAVLLLTLATVVLPLLLLLAEPNWPQRAENPFYWAAAVLSVGVVAYVSRKWRGSGNRRS